MSKPTTSFQKKPRGGAGGGGGSGGTAKRVEIPGTKPSIHNNQLLISTGIPSFDFLVGGGLAVGTLLIIEEDAVGSFAHLMLRYFIAEGVTTAHPLFLVAKHPASILTQIPKSISYDPVAEEDSAKSKSNASSTTSGPVSNNSNKNSAPDDDDELKIAWRYKDVKAQRPDAIGDAGSGGVTTGDRKFGHYFDLNANVDRSLLDHLDTEIVDLGEDNADLNEMDDYEWTLKECADFLDRKRIFVSSSVKPEERNICRIAVHSAGSPLWRSSAPHSLPRFLFRLKHLLRQSFACAVVTVPTGVLPVDQKFVSSLRHLGDYVVKLRSFAGTTDAENPALKDYHGLFEIVKLPRLNSLTRFAPATFDLAFKLRRKRFTIEKLHLPPDLAKTAEREQDDQATSTTTKTRNSKLKKSAALSASASSFGGGCGGMTGGSPLDF